MQSLPLKTFLLAGSIIAGSGSSTSSPDLKAVLTSRLKEYAGLLGHSPIEDVISLEEVQAETASASLYVLKGVQDLLLENDSEMIGTRDMTQLRTLSSIVFKWAVEPLLSRVMSAIPTITPAERHGMGVKIIDLTTVPEDYKHLSSVLTTLLSLILPQGLKASLAHTPIAADLVDKHLSDLLKPCIVLGWLPKSLASESVTPLDVVRSLVVHINVNIPVAQSVAALSHVLSDSVLPHYARKTCGFLLSKQLLRKEGVRGLFVALFSEEDISGDPAPFEKLEHVAKLLQAVPAGMDDTEYYRSIILQLLSILSAELKTIPPSHSRAAAFALSRILVPEQQTPRSVTASRILLPMLHRPLLQSSNLKGEEEFPDNENFPATFMPKASLNTLTALLTNTDPAPGLISSLLTPIIPSIYSLLHALEEHKTSDPTFKASVRGLLETWGRLVGEAEGVASLWLIVDGDGGYWSVDVAGQITRHEEDVSQRNSLSFFTPEDLKRAETAGELDINANILNLKPDPIRFVEYLKSINRTDISSEIFAKLLGAYQEAKSDSENDPTRTLLYLQIIMQIQSHLSGDSARSNILKKPDHILSFVKHALESAFEPPKSAVQGSRGHHGGLNVEDLRIVDTPEEEVDGDSDDEDLPGGSGNGDEEMTVTAINLLLSILEANPDMSTSNTPILDDMFDLLVRLAKEGLDNIRPSAREARMILTARLASTSVPPSSSKAKRSPAEESSQETYQKALKLLQDSLLPVRAHGLLLLRQLIAPRPTQSGKLEEPALDRALVPGILSIFLQSLQDDDSYIYLNAVQGLAAMVDGFGKEVLQGLVDTYSQGLQGVGGTSLTKQDVDTRTRIGEALGQVIRRCGETLPVYADILVPALFKMVRTSHLSTPLRTSALSLLAQCVNTSSLALLPYTIDLTGAMIDLLQVETVFSVPQTKFQPSGEGNQEPQTQAMDDQPTSTNSKFPPLRRAALHFLTLLTRAYMRYIADQTSPPSYILPRDVLQRANRTVGYIAVTDEDNVVRVMAKETLEGLNGLEDLTFGI